MHHRLVVFLVLCTCVYMVIHTSILQKNQSARIRARLAVFTTWTIAILVWPMLWACLLGEEKSKIAAIPSLIWPIIIILIDIVAMKQNTYETEVQSKHSVLSMDANAICSLTFAISGIIGAQNHKCCNRIFLFAVLGCVAFVMPAAHTHTNGIETITIEAAQKAILAYATGMLLSGILLVTSETDGLVRVK